MNSKERQPQNKERLCNTVMSDCVQTTFVDSMFG